MAAGAAEVKPRQMRAVISRARKWPVIADLVIGKGADKKIALAHVGKLALGVARRARK